MAFCADFTITSNADSGPGTLRDAINMANANGTATADLISFNLPGGALADRTITLLSSLPVLTSNITIDGTTQPGSALGVSDARVIVQTVAGLPTIEFNLFRIENAGNIALYGMKMLNNFTPLTYSTTFCVRGNNVRNIRVGAPGKGNIIAGWDYGCYLFGELNIPDNSYTMQSNMIGLLEDGETPAYVPYVTVARGFGITLIEGNTMAFSGSRLKIWPDISHAKITIRNNRLGTNYAGTKDLSLPWGEYSDYYHIIDIWQHGDWSASYEVDVLIKDNLLSGTCGSAINIRNNKGSTVIQGNKIGTRISGTESMGNEYHVGIDLHFCTNALIGGDGPGEGNTIAFARTTTENGNGIRLYGCRRITMSRNSTFCNADQAIRYYFYDEPERPPFIYINSVTTGQVTGRSVPNALVELFYDDECPNCEGKTYFATVIAGADGLWEYNGALQPLTVLATATGADGATSEFSRPEFDDSRITIVPSGCNQAKGGIKGVTVLSGISFHWENENGDIVSTDEELVNVPPGKYRLVISNGPSIGSSCKVNGPYYEIKEGMPEINMADMKITPAACKQKNGAITGIRFTGNDLAITWKDETGNIVSTAVEPDRLWPGTYTLSVRDGRTACTATAGPFNITDQGGTGPEIDITEALTTEATCDLTNGAIRNVKVNGAGTLSFSWEDETGKEVGKAQELLNIKAGNYVLKVKDGSTCPASASDPVTVPGRGTIRYDDAGVQTSMVTCTGDKGTITGITATGADTYRWVNAAGETVGHQLNLTGAEAGSYTLILSNAYDCENKTIAYKVEQEKPAPLKAGAYDIKPPSCNLSNGAVTGLVVTGGSPQSYHWLNSAGMEVSGEKDLENMPAGKYRLFVKDEKGCRQELLAMELKSPDLPVINESSMAIRHDECNRKEGSIRQLGITGEAPLLYTWYNETGAVAGNRADLLQAGSGTYYLYVEDKWGCHTESNRFAIGNTSNAPAPPTVPGPVIVKGMPAPLKVTAPGNGIYSLYSSNDANTLLEQNSTGEFTVQGLMETTVFYIGFHTGDCISTLSAVTVKVIDDIKIFVPTAFSPNNDGRNDRFRVTAYGMGVVYSFRVFDRWGYEIYTAKDIADGWDGRIRGADAPAGTYVWSLEGVDIKGGKISRYGVVTLVR